MLKQLIDEKLLKKVIDTTQMIEGYTEASKSIKEEVKKIREKHAIKVSNKI